LWIVGSVLFVIAVAFVSYSEIKAERHEDDLKRLWHYAGCPLDNCQQCINDAEWIKSLHKRLGPPSAASGAPNAQN
jgi:hypothetical protein